MGRASGGRKRRVRHAPVRASDCLARRESARSFRRGYRCLRGDGRTGPAGQLRLSCRVCASGVWVFGRLDACTALSPLEADGLLMGARPALLANSRPRLADGRAFLGADQRGNQPSHPGASTDCRGQDSPRPQPGADSGATASEAAADKRCREVTRVLGTVPVRGVSACGETGCRYCGPVRERPELL